MKQKPQTGELDHSQKTGGFLLKRHRKKKLEELIKRANTHKMLYEQAERELDEYLDAIAEGRKRVH